MAWDPDNISNDELLINAPALLRANFNAIETGTEASLLITNAKCAAGMGLVDTKLAQIVTASKVHGTALTGLASVPSGAGRIPHANSPNKLAADSLDSTPQYLDGLIDTDDFQVSAGDLLQLVPAKDPFQVGDWISSSVTTARTGWANVSATYANKFMRINATPLGTGGSDTHSHTLSTANLAVHGHGVGTYAAAGPGTHTHPLEVYRGLAGSLNPSTGGTAGEYAINSGAGTSHGHSITGSSANAGSGSAFSGANVSAYVQVTVFQKS